MRDADAAGDSGYNGDGYKRIFGEGRRCGTKGYDGDSAMSSLWRNGEDDEMFAVQGRGILWKGASESGLEGA